MSDDRNQLLNDQEQAMRELLDGRQVGIWTALPGIVTAVGYSAATVTVQPAIKGVIVDENGQEKVVSLPVLLDVPIVFPGCGAFALTFPIVAGDEVLVIFASRCIDAWWQSGGEQQAMEARMHDLSDGFAIPSPMSQKKAKPFSNQFCEIKGTGPGANAAIQITPAGNVLIVAAAEIDISAVTVKVNGDLVVSGDATIGGKTFSTHRHSGVTTGSGNTGAPV